jgi:hypothetical protein
MGHPAERFGHGRLIRNKYFSIGNRKVHDEILYIGESKIKHKHTASAAETAVPQRPALFNPPDCSCGE